MIAALALAGMWDLSAGVRSVGVLLGVSVVWGFLLYRIVRPRMVAMRQLAHTRDALILGLAKLADFRDSDTGKHLERISAFSGMLARAYELPADAPVSGSIADGPIGEDWITTLELASSLHDIGKVGIPDDILLKPGPLTTTEREIMQRHTEIGADTLIEISERLGKDDLVAMALVVALQHHERWDGSGYPMGLSGYDIALAARIVALADFYDALTSDRVYKSASTHEETRKLILENRGRHVDPAVVDAFERIHERMAQTKASLSPEGADPLRGIARYREKLAQESHRAA